jgi:tetrahydrodipicolinate N-succinyltransferase
MTKKKKVLKKHKVQMVFQLLEKNNWVNHRSCASMHLHKVQGDEKITHYFNVIRFVQLVKFNLVNFLSNSNINMIQMNSQINNFFN